METHDRRVVHARQFLTDACRQEPGALPADDLVNEDAELRRCLAWVIDVVDDCADTELDEDLTQVMFGGGLYIAPADVEALCKGCLRRLAGAQPPALETARRERDLPWQGVTGVHVIAGPRADGSFGR